MYIWFTTRWFTVYFEMTCDDIYMVFTIEGLFWSSYTKLAWVGFEPTATEFRSDALSDWAIRPWVQLAIRVQLALIFHLIKLGNHTKRWVLRFTWRFGICLLLMLFIKIYSCIIHIRVLQILQIFNWLFIIYNWYDVINKWKTMF